MLLIFILRKILQKKGEREVRRWNSSSRTALKVLTSVLRSHWIVWTYLGQQQNKDIHFDFPLFKNVFNWYSHCSFLFQVDGTWIKRLAGASNPMLMSTAPLDFWFWINAYKALVITLLITSWFSLANNANYPHWEKCEALFLISSWGRVIPGGPLVEGAQSHPCWGWLLGGRGALGPEFHCRWEGSLPELGVWAHGWSGAPGCRCSSCPSAPWAPTNPCQRPHTHTCTLRKVFLEEPHYGQISRRSH